MRVCPKKRWTNTDIQILKSLFPNSERMTILQAFDGRSWHSIEIKTGRLGVKRPNCGEKKPNWKGDKATDNSGRERARRLFPTKNGTEIHHVDGNPLNNDPANIRILTRRGHMIVDGRLFNRHSNGKFAGGN